MIVQSGHVEVVVIRDRGSAARGDQPAGSTTLAVADASAFIADGGNVVVNHFPADVLTPVTYPYTAVDFDLDVLTLATALTNDVEDGSAVNVTPSAVEKRAQVSLDHTGESIDARVPHNLDPYLVDGFRDIDGEEAVTVEQAVPGGEWVVKDVHGRDPVARSGNYQAGVSGSAMDDAAQFEGINVTGTLGADAVTADEMLLAGLDVGDAIAGGPRGVLAYDSMTSGVDTNSVVSESILFIMDMGGPYKADRFYLMGVRGALSTAANVGDTYRMRMRITNNATGPATIPTLSSTIMDGGNIDIMPAAAGGRPPVDHYWLWKPPADYQNLKMAVTGQRIAGTGGIQIMSDPNYRFQVMAVDLGSTGFNVGALAQKSKVTGSPDPDPITLYSKSWPATWAQTVTEYGEFYLRDDTGFLPRQGLDPREDRFKSNSGNLHSFLGFDYADIVSTLVGATITKVTLTFRMMLVPSSVGGDYTYTNVRIHAHNLAAPIPTTAGSLLAERDACHVGVTYAVTLPNSFGDDLKNSLAKGCGFGPGNNYNQFYWGTMYGVDASAPFLTVTYTK